MFAVHIYVECLQNGDFKQWINPWLVDEARDVEANGADVEGQPVCVFHQGTGTVEKQFLDFPGFRVFLQRVPFLEKALELRRSPLLTATVFGVVVEE